jgi:hypothetical protein
MDQCIFFSPLPLFSLFSLTLQSSHPIITIKREGRQEMKSERRQNKVMGGAGQGKGKANRAGSFVIWDLVTRQEN